MKRVRKTYTKETETSEKKTNPTTEKTGARRGSQRTTTTERNAGGRKNQHNGIVPYGRWGDPKGCEIGWVRAKTKGGEKKRNEEWGRENTTKC